MFTEDSNVEITKDKKSPASIYVISADGNINSVSDGGTIKLRGNSTALADKPAYNISFTNEQKVFKNAVADSAEVTVYPYGYNTLAPYNTYTYEQHVEYLKDWLKTRNEWICSQWNIN